MFRFKTFGSLGMAMTLMSVLLVPQTSAVAAPPERSTRFVAGEVIVQFDKSATDSEKAAVRALADATSSRPLSILASNAEVFTLRNDKAVESVAAALSRNPKVSFAEPNYLTSTKAVSNDPQFVDGTLWNMQGPTSGNAFGSNAVGAWAAGVVGVRKVYVAVIDQGIDYTHPDLSENIWTNPGEIPSNGIDDDKNGFVDDLHGYDFLNNRGEVKPATGENHATHVAGIIGALGGNSTGVAGVNWSTSIISVRALSQTGGTMAAAIAGIDYVTMLRTKFGVDVVATNNSWSSGSSFSMAMRDAIRRGGDAGILFVAAAGNSNLNNDLTPTFPATYDCSTASRPWQCVIAVAATDRNGNLAPFSNFGTRTTTIAAPGVDITSTVPGGYQLMSGTSMAAPHVTGALALCSSGFRGTPSFDALSLLRSTATPVSKLDGKVTTGILNTQSLVSACVASAKSLANSPSAVSASAIYTNRVRLDWVDSMDGEYRQEIQVAVGPNGCSGTFTHYAYIGPGLTSYPVTGLKESEFYCYRIRGNRDASLSAWKSSNLTITWSTNSPFISGRLSMADGNPVGRGTVYWMPANATSDSTKVKVFTDADGSYVLQAPSGTPGLLGIETPQYDRTSSYAKSSGFVYSNQILPNNLRMSGALTVTQDTTVNLTLPKTRTLTLNVIDATNNAPVPGAYLTTDSTSNTRNCLSELFPGARDVSGKIACAAWVVGSVAGNSSYFATADANGSITFSLLDDTVTTGRATPTTTLIAIHPRDFSRVGQSIFTVTQNQVITTPLAGTVNLTGRVLLSDGTTAVERASVYWMPKNALSDATKVRVYSDASGNYNIRIPNSIPGVLGLETPQYDRSSSYAKSAGLVYSTQLLPNNLRMDGLLTLSQDSTINLTIPKIRQVTFSVQDAFTGAAIAGSYFTTDSASNTRTCSSELFPGARDSNGRISCAAWTLGGIAGSAQYFPTANSSGLLTIAMLDDSVTTSRSSALTSVSAIDPVDKSRTAVVSFTVTKDQIIPISIGTLVNLSGKVVLNDGSTGAERVTVYWMPSNAVSDSTKVKVLSTSDGSYSLRVPAGVSGVVGVETPQYDRTSVYAKALNLTYSSQLLPNNLRMSGLLTITQDTVLKLTLPKIWQVTFSVVDAYTNTAVPYATFNTDSTSNSRTCNSEIFPGARDANGRIACSAWLLGGIAGNSQYFPVADSEGLLRLAVLDDSITVNRTMSTTSLVAIHPMDSARVGQTTFTVTRDQVVPIVVPGTPNVPKRPSALAGTTSVTLNWSEPWNGGAFIDYYRIWVATSINGPYVAVTQGTCAGNVPATSRSCVVEGLLPGVLYYFAVIAHNVVGDSQLSAPTAVLITSPTLKPAITPTFSLVSSNSGGFTVQILNASDALTITARVSSGIVVVGSLVGSVRTITVTGLTPSQVATLVVTMECAGCNVGIAQIDGTAG